MHFITNKTGKLLFFVTALTMGRETSPSYFDVFSKSVCCTVAGIIRYRYLVTIADEFGPE